MIDERIKRKLESLRKLPTIPTLISKVLEVIDNPKASAATIAAAIERDQSLTARILRVANSPFYGFSRRISTIDLAVVVMGTNTIREIILSLVVQKFFNNSVNKVFNIKAFWEYSLFCGSTARLLARKLGYKLAGEAFVTGLMHDIGILILADNFPGKFKEILKKVNNENLNLPDTERSIIDCDHAEIGAFIAQKWNLPEQLCAAILNHHTPYSKINKEAAGVEIDLDEINQPLTAIVSISEWLAEALNQKKWISDQVPFNYYLGKELFDDIDDEDIYDKESAFNLFKTEVLEEFERAKAISGF